ncbi:uncharacterized protein BDW70DRAFT_71790 [Aspergillus foveolatus]|uniref:uncharacterized protein n=1 Tax=Aspergillus foveolatus TaxID=210207 RepID=UPI003CCDD92D
MLLGHSGLLITWVDTLSLSVGTLTILHRVIQVANTIGRLRLLLARSHPRIAYNGKTGRANVDYFMHIRQSELLFQVQMSG